MMTNQPPHEHRWVAWEGVPAVPYQGLWTCAEAGCALTGTRGTLARLMALEEIAHDTSLLANITGEEVPKAFTHLWLRKLGERARDLMSGQGAVG